MAFLPGIGITRCGTLKLEWGKRSYVMGIINVTPDSFSDGGQFFGVDDAINHALKLAEEGADILDIGGESTRPYSTPVASDEELDRVMPVVSALAQRTEVPISIDTSKATVARECLNSGAEIINDVTGLLGDPEMVPLAAASDAGVCVMHMQGTPQTMQTEPHYDDVLQEVGDFFSERLTRLAEHGVNSEQVALDPGIGFGKELEHNIKLLSGIHQLIISGRPLLIGASRKSFIGKLLGTPSNERLPASLACAACAAAKGAHVVRVHDVAETVQAVRMTEALSDNR